jgi:putative ABC transport system permease protein
VVALTKLQRKLLRDLLDSKAQFGAITAIIVLGIAVFVGTYESYQNLYFSYQGTYDRLAMADYWVTVDHLPVRAVRDMNDIQGITAQGRIVREIRIDLELESGQRVEGRVVSLPSDSRPDINDVHIERGSYFTPGDHREILVEKSFADYHELQPGDWLTLERDDRKIPFQVAGVVISPEYIWVSKSPQEPAPTPRTFGVLFMPEQRAGELYGMRGLVNEIAFTVDPEVHDRALQQFKQVLRRYHIDRVTTEDDPLPVSTRKIDIIQHVRTAHMVELEDQPSHSLLKQDLDGFKQMSVLFPALFLTLAALAIYVLLNRLVESQRVQIGLMRALGYGKWRVLQHYMGYALVVGMVGSVVGAVLGHLLAEVWTRFYIDFIRVPFVFLRPQWSVVFIGVAIGILVPLFAGLLPAWSTSRLRPAEAMRPPAPPSGHRTLVEIIFPFMHRLPSTIKLPLRNVFRNPRRSLFMATGVMSATAMILVSMSFVDMMDWIMVTQFEKIQNYDARVIFQGIGGEATATYIDHLQGVEETDPILEQPYRLKWQDKVRDTAIMGLEPGSSMYNLITPDGSTVSVPEEGLLLPLPLQERLGAQPGDVLQLEPIIGVVGISEEPVAAIINEPMGGRAYLALDEVQDMLNLPGAATGVLLRFETQPSPQLLKRIYNLPQVASIEFASGFKAFAEEMMGFFWAFIGVMLAMSFGLGLAIIFNGVTVNVLERRREIATMRAVGMGNRQLTTIITLENLLIAAIGILIGLPAGYYIANYFMTQASTEMISMPAIIYTRSYLIAAASSIVILLISQLPAIRRVTTMSLPTVTKDWSE